MFSTLVSPNGTTTYQFHRIRGDAFVWVDISCASGIRDSFPKRIEARHGCIFHYLVDMGHFQSMLQVPFNERSGQQALLSKKAPDEASLGWGMIFCSPAKAFMYSPISSREMSVFLKMGGISANLGFRASGTRMSHYTTPKRDSSLMAVRI